MTDRKLGTETVCALRTHILNVGSSDVYVCICDHSCWDNVKGRRDHDGTGNWYPRIKSAPSKTKRDTGFLEKVKTV